MTKLTRVEEEDDQASSADRDNPFRPGSHLEREADFILRGSLVSRNSIQLGGCATEATTATVGDDNNDDEDTVLVATEAFGKEAQLQQQQLGSKGHVTINEATVFIVSPDTEVATAVIDDDDNDDDNDDAGSFHGETPTPPSALGDRVAVSPIALSTPATTGDANGRAVDGEPATPTMVEVQVLSATLNAASPSIAEAVSIEKEVATPSAAATSHVDAGRRRERGVSSGAAPKRLCCSLM